MNNYVAEKVIVKKKVIQIITTVEQNRKNQGGS